MADNGDDELERISSESIARLERGQLPVEAEQRLQALRGRTDFFTSDLTVNEVALGVDHGLRPISQVMGSCVYHVGMQLYANWGTQGNSYIRSVPVLAGAWNEARNTAIQRLREEAKQCGADAVLGVRISRSDRDFSPNSVEFVVLGTAVRVPNWNRAEHPIVTGLSGSEFWRLLSRGFVPVGLVANSSVIQAIADPQSQWAMARGPLSAVGSMNRDIENFGVGVDYAVAQTRTAIASAARGMNAVGVVGMRIDRQIQTIEVANGLGGGAWGIGSGGPSQRRDLLVTVHALGTAIARGAVKSPIEPLAIMPVRNLQTEMSG